jgi:hypothetical protein
MAQNVGCIALGHSRKCVLEPLTIIGHRAKAPPTFHFVVACKHRSTHTCKSQTLNTNAHTHTHKYMHTH